MELVTATLSHTQGVGRQGGREKGREGGGTKGGRGEKGRKGGEREEGRKGEREGGS